MFDAKVFHAHPHDCFVRLCLRDARTFASLLRICRRVKPFDAVDPDTLRCLNSDTINGKLEERMGDLCFSARFKGTDQPVEVFIFLEHQSAPDGLIPFRLLEYIVGAYRQFIATPDADGSGKIIPGRFPYPLAIVLYHGGKPWKGPLRMPDLIGAAPGVKTAVLDFPMHFIDVARLPVDRITDDFALRILLEALQAASQGTLDSRYESIMQLFPSLRHDSRVRQLFDGFIHYAAYLGKPARWIELAKRTMFRLFEPQEAEKMADTIYDEYVEIGVAKGKAEGRAEVVSSILLLRFGAIPEPVAVALQQCGDVAKLGALAITAVTCRNIDEFMQQLGS